MLLALARAVSTKVMLRPEGKSRYNDTTENKWDFLFHQSGMIGSAILFANGNLGAALRKLPAQRVNDTFAVSFDAGPNSAAVDTKSARQVVSKIAKLKVDRPDLEVLKVVLPDFGIFKIDLPDPEVIKVVLPDPKVLEVDLPDIDVIKGSSRRSYPNHPTSWHVSVWLLVIEPEKRSEVTSIAFRH